MSGGLLTEEEQTGSELSGGFWVVDSVPNRLARSCISAGIAQRRPSSIVLLSMLAGVPNIARRILRSRDTSVRKE
jgi:hypothetical protein